MHDFTILEVYVAKAAGFVFNVLPFVPSSHFYTRYKEIIFDHLPLLLEASTTKLARANVLVCEDDLK